ncbi:MAG: 5-dehydro-2-deoxygluconokinase [Gammaproteobacteria bacterium]|jgi:5-dehydro-2-deoxygluconokinase|nr:5-dehydro-2-deoxygluconokinase [Acidiferrobacteraceae bacterium]MCP4924841.1 5-dehydro-2-deoxygluconokinase [Gammaproteobacteria bacterium]|tara:strand:- start:1761 stop:3680 length:1920 start_codon:yes stop_codon:yes gene_type:complete
MKEKSLDLICIGRSSVDLYGQQVGGRLEDMGGFAKYVGGSPTNTSIGAARLGLKSALLTRVGDEHMGRFIRETLQREGVDTSHVITDPQRLTALVLLGIQDEEQFPLIFYRENCADMAICEDDIDENFIARSRTVLVSGTHLSTERVAAASHKAMKLGRKHGARVALDIDFRPNLWNLAGHGAGESRFIADQGVSTHLQKYLGDCDLIVGTEEEFQIAGESEESLQALANVRKLTDAVLVCKRGANGCRVFEGDIDGWESGIAGPGFRIEVFNVLGAGDAFMAGLLRGWLRDEGWETTSAYANACGAFAVSRHGCCPAYPSETELFGFIRDGSEYEALRLDPELNYIHRVTNRPRRIDRILAFAVDHRLQFEIWAGDNNRDQKAIGEFKQLAWQAAAAESQQDPGFAVLIDDQLGREALHRATSSGAWVGRPIEASGKFPLEFEAEGELVEHLADWPLTQTVKVLCPYRVDDDEATRQHHETMISRLDRACRFTGHEWLLEIITARHDREPSLDTVADIMRRFYEIGVKPDWWKLEPGDDASYWQEICDVIDDHDPYCQGVIVLGLNGSIDSLSRAFDVAALQPRVKGFAVGRTIFGETAKSWMAGQIDNQTAASQLRSRYREIITAWDRARSRLQPVN